MNIEDTLAADKLPQESMEAEIAALRQVIKDAIRVLNYDGMRPLNRLTEARAEMIASVGDIDRFVSSATGQPSGSSTAPHSPPKTLAALRHLQKRLDEAANNGDRMVYADAESLTSDREMIQDALAP